ncbi:MAG: hypothetical protein AAF153_00770 [Pseudomonadota bacterium]
MPQTGRASITFTTSQEHDGELIETAMRVSLSSKVDEPSPSTDTANNTNLVKLFADENCDTEELANKIVLSSNDDIDRVLSSKHRDLPHDQFIKFRDLTQALEQRHPISVLANWPGLQRQLNGLQAAR